MSLLSPRRSGSLAAYHPEERKDDSYSNSMLKAICAGVEDGVDKHFVILSVKFVLKSTVNALRNTLDVLNHTGTMSKRRIMTLLIF